MVVSTKSSIRNHGEDQDMLWGRNMRGAESWDGTLGRLLRNRDIGGKSAMRVLRLGWLCFPLRTVFPQREA